MLDPAHQNPPTHRRALPVVFAFASLSLVLLFFLSPVSKIVGRIPAAGTRNSMAGTHSDLWSISIDYPADGSIFPPGITPPTFLWRDGLADHWIATVVFKDHSPEVHFQSSGERMKLGAIDPDCISSTNEPPSLTPQQAASWAWTPDSPTWQSIQAHSTSSPATLEITGYRGQEAVSAARISFSTSTDPVGAPIFYRDVPLMPSKGANGTVQPLSPASIHLIRWRLRDIRQPESRTLLTNMPTCANCHSFSADGKTMGIDIDGPSNDKGLYAVVPTQRHISIQNKDMVRWNTDGQVGQTRVGFMSQVSPDGRYILSTFAGPSLNIPKTYYITNFKDYRFLQVFYPTRGILEWYNRATNRRQPLPGADDPQYVQTDGVWSPDGKTIVFARAVARDPYQDGQKPALHANDPNETPIQYDLYRIPFNDGKGGTPEPIRGASQNGMSNNFPKISPDGRWIVFVECGNGQLMRPDSQLYIVPIEGGTPRRLRANTALMNSWHSFSPNGRWLVFSSKARSPYTQMYLTHLDGDGNDSPAILIDNSTAANRAVNLPEFVNIAGDGIADIQVPAVDLYKLIEQAMHLEEQGENARALAIWKKALVMDANDTRVQNGIGLSLYIQGDYEESFAHLREAIRINPQFAEGHYNLGKFLLQRGHADQAATELEATVRLQPRLAPAQEGLASAYDALGNSGEALVHWRQALALDPKSVNALMGTSWLLATARDSSLRNGPEAVALASSANDLSGGANPEVLDTLAAALAETGQFQQAVAAATHALNLATATKKASLAAEIRNQIHSYSLHEPVYDQHSPDASSTSTDRARAHGNSSN